MSDFDYHTNFRTAPKRRTRAYSTKLWLKKIIYAVAVISSCVFLFDVFTSNSTQKNKKTITQPPIAKVDENIEITTQKVQNEIKVMSEVDQATLKTAIITETPDSEKILAKNTTPMTSIIKASASLKNYSSKLSSNKTFIKPGRNNGIEKVEEINLVANKKQNTQIDRITKQIAADKTMPPQTLKKTKLSVTKTTDIIPVKNNPEVTPTKNQSIVELIKSLKDEPQEIDSIKDIQNIYQRNLDQLSK